MSIIWLCLNIVHKVKDKYINIQYINRFLLTFSTKTVKFSHIYIFYYGLGLPYLLSPLLIGVF